MVDDHDLVRSRIGLGEGPGQVGDESGGFVAGADDDAYRMLLIMFFWLGGIEGQLSEEPTVVEELYQGDQTKNDKKQFEPGETHGRENTKNWESSTVKGYH